MRSDLPADSAIAPISDYAAGPGGVITRGERPVRPDSLLDTLLIEGTAEPVLMTLVHSPGGFAMPFSAYVPPGMDIAFEMDGVGAAVRFTAAFGAKPDPRAYMQVRLYNAATSLLAAEDVVRGFLNVRAPGTHEFRITETPSWAQEAYSLAYDGNDRRRYVGRAIVARHGALYFHVLSHYPSEYGDGLPPRISAILDSWRWEDSGKMLGAH